jgi:F-type H+-transporting ATPase subunit b
MKNAVYSRKPYALATVVLAVLLTFLAGMAWGATADKTHGTAVGKHETAAKEHGTAAGEHGSAGGEHGEAGAHAPVKRWVSTDTYRVMNFLVLAGALFLVLRKPVSQALSARIKGIQSQLDELETKKKEAERQLADYNKKLAQLDQEAEKIVAEYIKQGQDAKARILKEAEAAAAKLEEQARRNIDHEFKQAKEKLQADILERSLAKAEELIKGKITPEDQDRLVDEYLEKVVV